MYFRMEEDGRIQNRIQFRDIDIHATEEFEPDEVGRIRDVTVLFMEGDEDSVYPDVFQSPVYMVSDRLKKLLECYDDTVVYRRVALNQVKQHVQKMYWLLLAEKTQCLDESSEYYPNGWNKRIVLNRERIGRKRVFRVQGVAAPGIYVHVDVAESIMRREWEGIMFRPVQVCQEEREWRISERSL